MEVNDITRKIMELNGWKVPEMGEEYILNDILEDGALIIEGLQNYPTIDHAGWHAKNWKKAYPETTNDAISTEASRSLVKSLVIEKIGTENDKYLEEERELIMDADF